MEVNDMKQLYIVCYKRFEEPKMDSFKTDSATVDFIKTAKDDVVVESIFSVDCFGEVKKYVLKFNGQFFLEEEEGEG